MFELFKIIPINIWSVALGSLIALVGVLISNSFHTSRLKIQLKHDAELKAVERKATMRREVYLNAVEELTRANCYVGSLAQKDMKKTNIVDGLQNFFVAAAKLGLVAEDEMSQTLNRLVIAYNGLIFKLMPKVMSISGLKSDIEIANQYYEESQFEIKRILASMNSQNETGFYNENVFEALNKSFDFEQKKSKKLADEINDCWDKVNEKNKEFSLILMHEMKVISLLQAPVMVGIRKELDIDTNIETYIELTKKSSEQVEAHLEEFMASLKSELNHNSKANTQ